MQRKTSPSYITKRIASRLRGRFSEGGVTQIELAAATGISQSQLSKLLRGVRVFDVDQLDAVCQALGLEMGEVVAQAYDEAADSTHFEVFPGILDDMGERIDEDAWGMAAHHNDGKRREREAREDTP